MWLDSESSVVATGTVAAATTSSLTGTVSFVNSGDSVTLGTAALGAAAANLGFGTESDPTLTTSRPTVGSWDPYFIVKGDFNNDGKLDLVVADALGAPAGPTPPNALVVLLGNGDGTFTPGPASPLTSDIVGFFAAGDFNNDGKLDLAVTDIDSPDVVTNRSGACRR